MSTTGMTPPAPATRAGRRDRHGRGPRGPLAWPPVPAMGTRRDRFDDVVRDVAEEVDRLLEARGLVVEYAAMDIPTDFGPDWSPEVPLARTIGGTRTSPPRIIVFRRPIESRANSQEVLVAIVRAVISNEVSTLFAIPPEELVDFDDDF